MMTLEELEYLEIEGGSVIGILTKDLTDEDFGGIVMARDRNLRFRGVDLTGFFAHPQEAREALVDGMRNAARIQIEAHHQGDEVGEPVDFFAHRHEPARLNPSFVQLTTNEGYSPAREIIEPMMRWYEDADGNFVEQFQTTGFDQRMWELYLFALLIEAGYLLDRKHNVPDFSCSGFLGKLFVEAVTVGPTVREGRIVPPPAIDTPEGLERYLKDYMPIKFGSPLFSKLRKKYWLHPHVADAPLVLAVADFSSPMSMVHSQPALERYLWGYEHEGVLNDSGTLVITPRRIEQHQYDGKVIPSGFFRLPDSEHVSAVVSTNAGTIAKFNRLGVLGKFGSKRVLLVREGRMVDHDPNATTNKFFKVIVNSDGYEEDWIEGLNVYHNPGARVPLQVEMLPGAAHHFCGDDGQVTSFTPHFHPTSSITHHHYPVNVASLLADVGDKTHMIWTVKSNRAIPKQNRLTITVYCMGCGHHAELPTHASSPISSSSAQTLDDSLNSQLIIGETAGFFHRRRLIIPHLTPR
jgi:hypothetical protein